MITFTSRAAASVMMFSEVGQTLLELLGKEAGAQGILSLEQLPGAIAALEQAAAADRARQRALRETGADEEEVPGSPAALPDINLSQRIVPLLELLRVSLKAGEPVVWRTSAAGLL
jgi:hypothetical protein